VAPGNAGIAQIADYVSIDIEDGGAVAHFAEANAIDFVIIVPEAPLAAGVADRLRDAGLFVFGSFSSGSRARGVRPFTKEICDAAGALTAAYARFTEIRRPRPMCTTKARPLLSKQMGWPQAKA